MCSDNVKMYSNRDWAVVEVVAMVASVVVLRIIIIIMKFILISQT